LENNHADARVVAFVVVAFVVVALVVVALG
jgi:hypothetical protein